MFTLRKTTAGKHRADTQAPPARRDSRRRTAAPQESSGTGRRQPAQRHSLLHQLTAEPFAVWQRGV